MLRVQGRLGRRQHGRDAGIAVLEHRRPMRQRLFADQRRHPLAQRRPLARIVLRRDRRQAQALHQFAVEGRLDGAQRQPAPIGAFEAVVEMRAVQEEVAFGVLVPSAARAQRLDQRPHVADAVDDRGVHHLAPTGATRLPECAHQPEQHRQRTATDVAQQGGRQRRRLPRPPRERHQPAERHVVDVMASGACERAGLAPAGQPRVDQPRMRRQQRVGTQPQPLHHAGPEALDQRIGLRDQLPHPRQTQR